MSRKAFIARGLILALLVPLIPFVLSIWNFGDLIFLMPITYLALTTGFLFLFWNRIQATGQRKIGLLWLGLFLIAAVILGLKLASFYFDYISKNVIFTNDILHMVSTVGGALYLLHWGFFAAFFVFGRDPKVPLQFFKNKKSKRESKRKIKRAGPRTIGRLAHV